MLIIFCDVQSQLYKLTTLKSLKIYSTKTTSFNTFHFIHSFKHQLCAIKHKCRSLHITHMFFFTPQSAQNTYAHFPTHIIFRFMMFKIKTIVRTIVHI